MISFLRRLLTLPTQVTEQQNAIESLRKRCLALETENKTLKEEGQKRYRELRAASQEEATYSGLLGRLMWGGCYESKPYTAMDAVRVLLKHQGLTMELQHEKQEWRLVPVKKTKK